MSRYSAYCLLPSAFCLLLTAFRPSRDTGTIASILADIGYYVKKFMYSMGNNLCDQRGEDSLSEGCPSARPSAAGARSQVSECGRSVPLFRGVTSQRAVIRCDESPHSETSVTNSRSA